MGKHKRKVHSKGTSRPRTGGRGLLIGGVLAVAVLAGLATWYFLPRESPLGNVPPYTGGARLAVDRDLIDFGTVRFEKFVQARFRLRNVGDQPLRLAASSPVEVVEGC